MPQVCALVRNDMQKTVTRLRLQGRGARKVCRRRRCVSGCKDVFRQYTGSAQEFCGHVANFCMSLRGAERWDNP